MQMRGQADEKPSNLGSGVSDAIQALNTNVSDARCQESSVSGEIPARISASEIKGEIGRNAGDIRDLHHFFSKWVQNAAKRQLLSSSYSH